jgi:hypothetical protein
MRYSVAMRRRLKRGPTIPRLLVLHRIWLINHYLLGQQIGSTEMVEFAAGRLMESTRAIDAVTKKRRVS